jgi:hypothetical protein
MIAPAELPFPAPLLGSLTASETLDSIHEIRIIQIVFLPRVMQ